MKNTPSDSGALSNNYKIHKCAVCNRIFNKRNAYLHHFLQHEKSDDAYVCNICGKSFAVPARLTRHFRTHTGEKPFQCEYCKKSFSVKENLSVHRRIHTKERPYQCNICSKAFEHSGKLHRHMRIHTGERPHKCIFCNKTFIQSGQLVIHMRTHTGEKPYICKSCGKGFTCSKQLKVHSRTHTGEKPYKCNICFKSFGYNHVLKLHQASHYGEKFFKCILCQETFNSKKLMEIHVKEHSKYSVNYSEVIKELPVKVDHNRTDNITNNSVRSRNDEETVRTSCGKLKTSEKVNNKTYVYAFEIVQSEPNTVNERKKTSKALDSHDFNETNLNKTEAICSQNFSVNGETSIDRSDLGVYSEEDLDSDKRCITSFDKNTSLLENFDTKQLKKTISAWNTASTSALCFKNPDSDVLKNPMSNLPPRKRCKMILDSMEIDTTEKIRMRRCNSVIKYARRSGLQ